jgi:hypothetical protein
VQVLEVEPLREFEDALPNLLTRKKYEKRLDIFLRFTKVEGKDVKERARSFVKLAKSDPQSATILINDYMRSQRERAERKEISEATLPGYFKPIRLLLEMNDVVLNWKKISRRIPQGSHFAHDRPPLPEEVKIILGYPDRRMRPAVLAMVSSGIRVGAFDYLNVGHIEPIETDGEVRAARMKVYAGEKEEYSTFISGEAYRAISEYLAYRKSVGERVGSDSPLIRDLVSGDRMGRGEPHLPKRCNGIQISNLIQDALKAGNLRTGLKAGSRRYDFQAAHGFRKYFKTVCERRMKSLNVELLLGHSVGLGDNYYRPTVDELLQDYLQAIPDLTILETVKPESESILELKRRVGELERQNQEYAEAVEQMGPLLRQQKEILTLIHRLEEDALQKRSK